MSAIGCLLLIILPIAGVALGGLIAGPGGARWGGVAGLAIAAVMCGLAAYAMIKATQRR